MPVIRVDMWPGRSHTQKAEIARLITQAMSTIALIPPEATTIIFQDIPKDSWAIGGVLASDSDK